MTMTTTYAGRDADGRATTAAEFLARADRMDELAYHAEAIEAPAIAEAFRREAETARAVARQISTPRQER
jgi:hypothetical protein